MARRCVLIRLDPKHPKPHERTGFKHPDIRYWVSESRMIILRALLILCRNWYANNTRDVEVPAFGSFEEWTKAVGSVLGLAGYKGFLANREQLWEQMDTDSDEWELFLQHWHKEFKDHPVTVKVLIDIMQKNNDFQQATPSNLLDAVFASSNPYAKIGLQLRGIKSRRFGSQGFRLEKGPKKNSGNTWVLAWDEPGKVEG